MVVGAYDFFLNKNVVVLTKYHNWRYFGVLIDVDEHFLFLRFKDGAVKGIAKEEIIIVDLDKKV